MNAQDTSTIITIHQDWDCPGLRYTFHEVFTQRLGVNWKLAFSAQKADLLLHQGDKQMHLPAPLQLAKLDTRSYATNKAFTLPSIDDFTEFDENNGLRLDVFSAIFFLWSRYEECESAQVDEHGRFRSEASTLHKFALLQQPIVDVWLQQLRDVFLAAGWEGIRQNQFSYCNSYDIDQPFAVKTKPIFKVLGRMMLDVLRLHPNDALKRLQVALGNEDPFSVSNITSEVPFPQVFWLLAQNTRFDKNSALESPQFLQLLDKLPDSVQNGLHPSYYSCEAEDKLVQEMALFQEYFKHKPLRSRQHYLRFRWPHTQKLLATKGIQEDWSMGYANNTGFRAGTSLPFGFYHLLERKAYALQIVPFCIMDVTLKHYLKLSPENAMKRIDALQNTLALTKGKFVSLWHNESLSEMAEWRGWSKVHRHMLQKQSELV